MPRSIKKGIDSQACAQAYATTGSVKTAGKLLGVCGQTVWYHLKKIGVATPHHAGVRASVADRFWAKVKGPVSLSACWIWLGGQRGKEARFGQGHGHFFVKGKLLAAHRYAYEQVRGPIPEGMVLDHLCRVRTCVNPGHLEPVSDYENVMRGQNLAARNARKTECPRGHPYDASNTVVLRSPNGRVRRECGICRNEWNARRNIEDHRIVMEGVLGRKLTSGEYVHHVDGDFHNNRLFNLVLMFKPEHSRFHLFLRHRGLNPCREVLEQFCCFDGLMYRFTEEDIRRAKTLVAGSIL